MPGRIKGISLSILGKLPRRILARMPGEIPRGIPEGITEKKSGGDLRGIPESLEAAGIAYVIPRGVPGRKSGGKIFGEIPGKK